MLLPKQTEITKKNILAIDKFKKFAQLSTASRKEIDENVVRMRIVNVLRESTINVEKGTNVVEIDVYEIQLGDNKELSDRLIQEIDAVIPKHIIYLLRYKEAAQLVVSYKEKSQTTGKNKVIKTYRTEWKNYETFEIAISGLNLDAVFDNIISQIAGGKIETNEQTNIKQAIEKSVDIEKIKRKIMQLENKKKKEPQLNKRLAIKHEADKLKMQLKEMGVIWNN